MTTPRVLILNQPFVSDTGGGITLSNLFSDFDSKKLAVACSGYLLTDVIEVGKCNNYYQLGHEERKWMFPFNLISRKYQSGPVRFTDQSKDKVIPENEKSKKRTRFILKYVEPMFEYLGLVHFMAKTKLSPNFCKWMDDFNPDVIYAQCSSRESILFTIALHKYLNKPMVFHMMDDWPSLLGRKGFMKVYWKRKIDKEFRLLLDRSQLLMGISDYMCEEYGRRYGKKFITFHNPIDTEFWKKGQKPEYDIGKSPAILYAGRIGLGIDNSLTTIASAIDKVNTELGFSIRFIVQAQESPVWLKNYNCTSYQEFVPYKQLPSVFGKADFMVLPYDFDPTALNFIRYSMPTKASEYMASGTPVIIFAPEDTALVQYAKKYRWAAIITENKVNALADLLKKLVLGKDLRERLADTADRLAKKRHDVKLVAGEFKKAIQATIEATDNQAEPSD